MDTSITSYKDIRLPQGMKISLKDEDLYIIYTDADGGHYLRINTIYALPDGRPAAICHDDSRVALESLDDDNVIVSDEERLKVILTEAMGRNESQAQAQVQTQTEQTTEPTQQPSAAETPHKYTVSPDYYEKLKKNVVPPSDIYIFSEEEIRAKTREMHGVDSMEHPDMWKSPDGKTQMHFGNPFPYSEYGEAAVGEYWDWLIGLKHRDVEPVRREYIAKAILSGAFYGRDILYSPSPDGEPENISIKTKPCHAHALLYLVNHPDYFANMLNYTQKIQSANLSPAVVEAFSRHSHYWDAYNWLMGLPLDKKIEAIARFGALRKEGEKGGIGLRNESAQKFIEQKGAEILKLINARTIAEIKIPADPAIKAKAQEKADAILSILPGNNLSRIYGEMDGLFESEYKGLSNAPIAALHDEKSDAITEFKNEYRFLSNFWKCPVIFDGELYDSAENAYQAAKCANVLERTKFKNINPADAKKLGKEVKLRSDWESVKDSVMTEIIFDKFTRNPELWQLLDATGDKHLVEGNLWNDTYWGVDLKSGKGENRLGNVLMSVRQEIRTLNQTLADRMSSTPEEKPHESRIYVSYYGSRAIPEDAFRVKISNSAPDAIKIDHDFKSLHPDYNNTVKALRDGLINEDEYTRRYQESTLNANRDAILSELEQVKAEAAGRDIYLLCYEKPGDFCHRYLVNNFLIENGIQCQELPADRARYQTGRIPLLNDVSGQPQQAAPIGEASSVLNAPVENKPKANYYKGDITPQEGVVFVFGSNPEGRHGLGSAKVAAEEFGAVMGQGEGRQGMAYAIPTKDLRVTENNSFRSISPEDITASIARMYDYAGQHPDLTFKVAYRNTNKRSLNGYTGFEMMRMFIAAGPIPTNVQFSQEWINSGFFLTPNEALAGNITFTCSEGRYAQRTQENADAADVTIDVSASLSTPGEIATKKSAGSKFIAVETTDFTREGAVKTAKDLFSKLPQPIQSGAPVVVNFAGNGIYTLSEHGINQEAADRFAADVVTSLRNLGLNITSGRSGGQTGMDEAWLKSLAALGIPAICHAPAGWAMRGENKKDSYDETLFKHRFLSYDYVGLQESAANALDIKRSVLDINWSKRRNAALSMAAHFTFTMTEDGEQIVFGSVEQYMQFKKLSFSGCDAISLKSLREQILSTLDPYALRNLGRNVPQLDRKGYMDNYADILRYAYDESFKQNPKRKQILLETGDSILTCASENTFLRYDVPNTLMEIRDDYRIEAGASNRVAVVLDSENYPWLEIKKLDSSPKIREEQAEEMSPMYTLDDRQRTPQEKPSLEPREEEPAIEKPKMAEQTGITRGSAKTRIVMSWFGGLTPEERLNAISTTRWPVQRNKTFLDARNQLQEIVAGNLTPSEKDKALMKAFDNLPEAARFHIFEKSGNNSYREIAANFSNVVSPKARAASFDSLTHHVEHAASATDLIEHVRTGALSVETTWGRAFCPSSLSGETMEERARDYEHKLIRSNSPEWKHLRDDILSCKYIGAEVITPSLKITDGSYPDSGRKTFSYPDAPLPEHIFKHYCDNPELLARALNLNTESFRHFNGGEEELRNREEEMEMLPEYTDSERLVKLSMLRFSSPDGKVPVGTIADILSGSTDPRVWLPLKTGIGVIMRNCAMAEQAADAIPAMDMELILAATSDGTISDEEARTIFSRLSDKTQAHIIRSYPLSESNRIALLGNKTGLWMSLQDTIFSYPLKYVAVPAAKYDAIRDEYLDLNASASDLYRSLSAESRDYIRTNVSADGATLSEEEWLNLHAETDLAGLIWYSSEFHSIHLTLEDAETLGQYFDLHPGADHSCEKLFREANAIASAHFNTLPAEERVRPVLADSSTYQLSSILRRLPEDERHLIMSEVAISGYDEKTVARTAAVMRNSESFIRNRDVRQCSNADTVSIRQREGAISFGLYEGPLSSPFMKKLSSGWTMDEVIEATRQWLVMADYRDVEPERREELLKKIFSGKLQGKRIVASAEKRPYADWLLSVINNPLPLSHELSVSILSSLPMEQMKETLSSIGAPDAALLATPTERVQANEWFNALSASDKRRVLMNYSFDLSAAGDESAKRDFRLLETVLNDGTNRPEFLLAAELRSFMEDARMASLSASFDEFLSHLSPDEAALFGSDLTPYEKMTLIKLLPLSSPDDLLKASLPPALKQVFSPSGVSRRGGEAAAESRVAAAEARKRMFDFSESIREQDEKTFRSFLSLDDAALASLVSSPEPAVALRSLNPSFNDDAVLSALTAFRSDLKPKWERRSGRERLVDLEGFNLSIPQIEALTGCRKSFLSPDFIPEELSAEMEGKSPSAQAALLDGWLRGERPSLAPDSLRSLQLSIITRSVYDNIVLPDDAPQPQEGPENGFRSVEEVMKYYINHPEEIAAHINGNTVLWLSYSKDVAGKLKSAYAAGLLPEADRAVLQPLIESGTLSPGAFILLSDDAKSLVMDRYPVITDGWLNTHPVARNLDSGVVSATLFEALSDQTAVGMKHDFEARLRSETDQAVKERLLVNIKARTPNAVADIANTVFSGIGDKRSVNTSYINGSVHAFAAKHIGQAPVFVDPAFDNSVVKEFLDRINTEARSFYKIEGRVYDASIGSIEDVVKQYYKDKAAEESAQADPSAQEGSDDGAELQENEEEAEKEVLDKTAITISELGIKRSNEAKAEFKKAMLSYQSGMKAKYLQIMGSCDTAIIENARLIQGGWQHKWQDMTINLKIKLVKEFLSDESVNSVSPFVMNDVTKLRELTSSPAFQKASEQEKSVILDNIFAGFGSETQESLVEIESIRTLALEKFEALSLSQKSVLFERALNDRKNPLSKTDALKIQGLLGPGWDAGKSADELSMHLRSIFAGLSAAGRRKTLNHINDLDVQSARLEGIPQRVVSVHTGKLSEVSDYEIKTRIPPQRIDATGKPIPTTVIDLRSPSQGQDSAMNQEQMAKYCATRGMNYISDIRLDGKSNAQAPYWCFLPKNKDLYDAVLGKIEQAYNTGGEVVLLTSAPTPKTNDATFTLMQDLERKGIDCAHIHSQPRTNALTITSQAKVIESVFRYPGILASPEQTPVDERLRISEGRTKDISFVKQDITSPRTGLSKKYWIYSHPASVKITSASEETSYREHLEPNYGKEPKLIIHNSASSYKDAFYEAASESDIIFFLSNERTGQKERELRKAMSANGSRATFVNINMPSEKELLNSAEYVHAQIESKMRDGLLGNAATNSFLNASTAGLPSPTQFNVFIVAPNEHETIFRYNNRRLSSEELAGSKTAAQVRDSSDKSVDINEQFGPDDVEVYVNNVVSEIIKQVRIENNKGQELSPEWGNDVSHHPLSGLEVSYSSVPALTTDPNSAIAIAYARNGETPRVHCDPEFDVPYVTKDDTIGYTKARLAVWEVLHQGLTEHKDQSTIHRLTLNREIDKHHLTHTLTRDALQMQRARVQDILIQMGFTAKDSYIIASRVSDTAQEVTPAYIMSLFREVNRSGEQKYTMPNKRSASAVSQFIVTSSPSPEGLEGGTKDGKEYESINSIVDCERCFDLFERLEVDRNVLSRARIAVAVHNLFPYGGPQGYSRKVTDALIERINAYEEKHGEPLSSGNAEDFCRELGYKGLSPHLLASTLMDTDRVFMSLSAIFRDGLTGKRMEQLLEGAAKYMNGQDRKLDANERSISALFSWMDSQNSIHMPEDISSLAISDAMARADEYAHSRNYIETRDMTTPEITRLLVNRYGNSTARALMSLIPEYMKMRDNGEPVSDALAEPLAGEEGDKKPEIQGIHDAATLADFLTSETVSSSGLLSPDDISVDSLEKELNEAGIAIMSDIDREIGIVSIGDIEYPASLAEAKGYDISLPALKVRTPVVINIDTYQGRQKVYDSPDDTRFIAMTQYGRDSYKYPAIIERIEAQGGVILNKKLRNTVTLLQGISAEGNASPINIPVSRDVLMIIVDKIGEDSTKAFLSLADDYVKAGGVEITDKDTFLAFLRSEEMTSNSKGRLVSIAINDAFGVNLADPTADLKVSGAVKEAMSAPVLAMLDDTLNKKQFNDIIKCVPEYAANHNVVISDGQTLLEFLRSDDNGLPEETQASIWSVYRLDDQSEETVIINSLQEAINFEDPDYLVEEELSRENRENINAFSLLNEMDNPESSPVMNQQPPMHLNYRGDLSLLNNNDPSHVVNSESMGIVAIHGELRLSTNPNNNPKAIMATKSLVYELDSLDRVTIGASLNCATGVAAIEAALQKGIRVVAITADSLTAPKHQPLIEKIINQGGLVISEAGVLPGEDKDVLLTRSARILANVASANVVVEAMNDNDIRLRANPRPEMAPQNVVKDSKALTCVLSYDATATYELLHSYLNVKDGETIDYDGLRRALQFNGAWTETMAEQYNLGNGNFAKYIHSLADQFDRKDNNLTNTGLLVRGGDTLVITSSGTGAKERLLPWMAEHATQGARRYRRLRPAVATGLTLEQEPSVLKFNVFRKDDIQVFVVRDNFTGIKDCIRRNYGDDVLFVKSDREAIKLINSYYDMGYMPKDGETLPKQPSPKKTVLVYSSIGNNNGQIYSIDNAPQMLIKGSMEISNIKAAATPAEEFKEFATRIKDAMNLLNRLAGHRGETMLALPSAGQASVTDREVTLYQGKDVVARVLLNDNNEIEAYNKAPVFYSSNENDRGKDLLVTKRGEPFDVAENTERSLRFLLSTESLEHPGLYKVATSIQETKEYMDAQFEGNAQKIKNLEDAEAEGHNLLQEGNVEKYIDEVGMTMEQDATLHASSQYSKIYDEIQTQENQISSETSELNVLKKQLAAMDNQDDTAKEEIKNRISAKSSHIETIREKVAELKDSVRNVAIPYDIIEAYAKFDLEYKDISEQIDVETSKLRMFKAEKELLEQQKLSAIRERENYSSPSSEADEGTAEMIDDFDDRGNDENLGKSGTPEIDFVADEELENKIESTMANISKCKDRLEGLSKRANELMAAKRNLAMVKDIPSAVLLVGREVINDGGRISYAKFIQKASAETAGKAWKIVSRLDNDLMDINDAINTVKSALEKNGYSEKAYTSDADQARKEGIVPPMTDGIKSQHADTLIFLEGIRAQVTSVRDEASAFARDVDTYTGISDVNLDALHSFIKTVSQNETILSPIAKEMEMVRHAIEDSKEGKKFLDIISRLSSLGRAAEKDIDSLSQYIKQSVDELSSKESHEVLHDIILIGDRKVIVPNRELTDKNLNHAKTNINTLSKEIRQKTDTMRSNISQIEKKSARKSKAGAEVQVGDYRVFVDQVSQGSDKVYLALHGNRYTYWKGDPQMNGAPETGFPLCPDKEFHMANTFKMMGGLVFNEAGKMNIINYNGDYVLPAYVDYIGKGKKESFFIDTRPFFVVKDNGMYNILDFQERRFVNKEWSLMPDSVTYDNVNKEFHVIDGSDPAKEKVINKIPVELSKNKTDNHTITPKH